MCLDRKIGICIGSLSHISRAKAAPCFIVAKPNNETFKRGLHYFGAVQWDSLPAKIRNENSLFSFKSKQKNDLKKLVY